MTTMQHQQGFREHHRSHPKQAGLPSIAGGFLLCVCLPCFPSLDTLAMPLSKHQRRPNPPLTLAREYMTAPTPPPTTAMMNQPLQSAAILSAAGLGG